MERMEYILNVTLHFNVELNAKAMHFINECYRYHFPVAYAVAHIRKHLEEYTQ